jgi:hypothetical protein
MRLNGGPISDNRGASAVPPQSNRRPCEVDCRRRRHSWRAWKVRTTKPGSYWQTRRKREHQACRCGACRPGDLPVGVVSSAARCRSLRGLSSRGRGVGGRCSCRASHRIAWWQGRSRRQRIAGTVACVAACRSGALCMAWRQAWHGSRVQRHSTGPRLPMDRATSPTAQWPGVSRDCPSHDAARPVRRAGSRAWSQCRNAP